MRKTRPLGEGTPVAEFVLQFSGMVGVLGSVALLTGSAAVVLLVGSAVVFGLGLLRSVGS